MRKMVEKDVEKDGGAPPKRSFIRAWIQDFSPIWYVRCTEVTLADMTGLPGV